MRLKKRGGAVSAAQIRKVIAAYLSGNMDGKLEAIYDGAVYACSLSAKHCFNDDPEDDIDYEIDWLEQSDGSFVAEVRPN